jgi:hypothetical protein
VTADTCMLFLFLYAKTAPAIGDKRMRRPMNN